MLPQFCVKIPNNILFHFFHVNNYNVFFFFSKNGKIKILLKKHPLFFCEIQKQNLIFNFAFAGLTVQQKLEIKCLLKTYIAFFSRLLFDLNNRFKIVLDLRGIGYRFAILNSKLIFFYWGFSHPVKFIVPKNVLISAIDEKNKILTLESMDRHLVMRTAFLILRLRKFNVYSGKGICFLNQQMRTKTGKKTATKK